jgi:hypothetical protein
MSRAAKQLHEWIDEKFPGTRVSRYSCRDTASGAVSQHSAKRADEYDSNALDIMGDVLGSTWAENVARIQEVVDAIEPYREEWSIRLILWQVPDHFGHCHIDFWPTCHEHKWCGRDIQPLFMWSDGSYEYTQDPDPEYGDYSGDENMATVFKIGTENPQWEPWVWLLYMLEGGVVNPNINSSQVQAVLPWKSSVRLVQEQDFDLLGRIVGLSETALDKMKLDGIYSLGKELSALQERAFRQDAAMAHERLDDIAQVLTN